MRPTISNFILYIIQAVLVAGGVTLAIILITHYAGGPALSISQISTDKQSTFDVSGESKISTVPDQAEIRLGIVVNDSTVKAAQDKANTIINDINSKVGGLGVDKKDIKTESYSLYPNYDYQTGGAQKISGYSVNANLVITMQDFAKVNQAIDLATGAGANQISGISFTLSDAKKAEVDKQARQEAINNAKDKAQELAGLAGMKLGRIVNVSETPINSGVVMPYLAKGMAADAVQSNSGAAPTNVEPGSTTVDYQVTISYETF